ncbi:MAG: Rieske 2Fe-2S domain-containing protein, partial [Proteobacteria bacterium]|nr:Rieske 2Fe-2S domain-containing protein [Pseudomonadota bacterium]
SLYFGRNEECGIRCIYHGWKFDVEGNCVDMPSEPPATDFSHKIKLTAYPTAERGGILWTYMGPAELMGQIPSFEWLDVGEGYRYASNWHQDCNYAQSVEGEIDSAHVSFLHSRIDKPHEQNTALTGEFFTGDRAPKWKVNDTDYGLVLGARRHTDDGYYWRMNQWLFPFYTMIAPVPGFSSTGRAWVPIDDTHTSVFTISYRTDQPCTDEELDNWQRGLSSHSPTIPGTRRMTANRDNDYLKDLDAQRTQTYSGMPGVRAEDAAMAESQGPILDRTLEHLGTSDTAIIRMRRLLVDAAKALEQGEEPAPAKGGKLYAVRSHSVVIQEDADFDEKPEILEAMVV